MQNNKYINLSSLRFQMFISMFLIIVIFITAKFLIDYKDNEKQTLNYLVNTNKTINTFLAQNVRESIYKNDFDNIKNIIGSIENPYIKNILILNPQGTILYSKLEEKRIGENYSLSFLANKNDFLFYSSFEFLDVNMGYQIIEANDAQYRTELLAQIKELFFFACMSSFFGIILSFILSTYISKPINEIISKLDKSRKDSYIKFDKQKITEFDFLAQTVQLQRNKLIELNRGLAIKIKKEVSKSQQIEKKLFESEKLAAMGEMIGNIAHQWRQPLSVISTIASGLVVSQKFGILELDKLESNMTNIVTQSKYLSETIDDFSNFIKNTNVESTFTINQLVDRLLSLTSSALKNNEVNVIKNISADYEMSGFQNELIQALINIINNAKDAVVSNDKIPERYIFIETQYIDNKKELIIYDNGGGIKKEFISKIFEPYFTTKHQSLGTGIGLHMTYNILVLKHRASVDVFNYGYIYNEMNFRGAKFLITFE